MFILLLMICLLTGCKTSEKKLAEESKEPVKISIILPLFRGLSAELGAPWRRAGKLRNAQSSV